MDNPEKLATLGPQDTRRNPPKKKQKKKQKPNKNKNKNIMQLLPALKVNNYDVHRKCMQ